ncbi:MAG: metal ABC transporter substrate-binding protein [Pseudomonadota bacterium]|nr:metal ABC transporter substrate-binding protein [Pseudomonadota bacterium]
MRTFRRSWTPVLAAMLWVASSVSIAAHRPVVYAVNYPLQYFAERIAGDHAEVVLPVPSDADPAFWHPDAATIGGFQRADLILLNGAGYARWINRVSLPRRKLVDTSASFRDRFIDTEERATHSHGREGEHSHAGTAFTTWLDFSQAVAQAGAVRDALSRLMPELSDTFAGNFLALERDLLDLDAKLTAIVARDPEKPLIASHPVYQYLSRRYSLNLASVTWEPDALPPETEWKVLAELHEGHAAAWMLWEGTPAPEIRKGLRQLGIRNTVYDPCGNRPGVGDFLTVMSNNVANITRVFDQGVDNQDR